MVDPDSGIGSPNFKLRHDGTRTYDVLPGTYTLDERAASGYELTGVACDDSDSTGSTANRRATFHIAADEQVTCPFNEQEALAPAAAVDDAAHDGPADGLDAGHLGPDHHRAGD